MSEETKPRTAEEVRAHLMNMGRGLNRDIMMASYDLYAEIQRTITTPGVDWLAVAPVAILGLTAVAIEIGAIIRCRYS